MPVCFISQICRNCEYILFDISSYAVCLFGCSVAFAIAIKTANWSHMHSSGWNSMLFLLFVS